MCVSPRAPALLSVRCVWRAPLSVRAPGLAALLGSPGALLGRREQGSQLCAPCRLRRDSGPHASPPPHISPPRAAAVQKRCRAGSRQGRPGAGEGQREETGTGGGRRPPLAPPVGCGRESPADVLGSGFLGIRDGKKAIFALSPNSC